MTDEQRAAMNSAQEHILGPRSSRGLCKPEVNKREATYTGATAVERSCRNDEKTRSHTYGPSLQRQNCIISPPSSSKLAKATTRVDENLQLRNELLKVSITRSI